MKTSATPDFAKLSAPELAEVIGSRSHTLRLNAQRELLRRPKDAVAVAALSALARKADAEGTARIAAIFTLSQWLGAEAVNGLMELAKDAKVREFAIRALGDRPEATKAVPTEFFVQALSDPNDHVKLQAAVALSRLGLKDAANALLEVAAKASPPLSAETSSHPAPSPAGEAKQKRQENAINPNDPSFTDLDRILPHVASRALIALGAEEVCLKALDSEPSKHDAALRVLRNLPTPKVVSGLLERLPKATAPALRQGILTALARHYFVEGPWDGSSWGTRPDTSGPYYKREKWAHSPCEFPRRRSLSAKKTNTIPA